MAKEIKDIIADVEAHYRDIRLDEILENLPEQRSPNEKFITEIIELLSTTSNQNDFLNERYFIDYQQFRVPNYPIQSERSTLEMVKFLRGLWSEYKYYDGFTPETILSSILLEDFKMPRKWQ